MRKIIGNLIFDENDEVLLENDIEFLYDIGDVVKIKEYSGLEWSAIVQSRYFDEDCIEPHISNYWYVVEPLADKPNFRTNPSCVTEREIKGNVQTNQLGVNNGLRHT